jgi:dCMP deaminase
MSSKWDVRFLQLAAQVSTWSKDKATQVGCCVVGPDREVRSLGYNGFPRGVNDDVADRHERPAKYLYTSHAEENAICNASRFGASLCGCTLFCTHPACARCARAIIQSGIVRVVWLHQPKVSWESELPATFMMFSEAQVATLELQVEIATPVGE